MSDFADSSLCVSYIFHLCGDDTGTFWENLANNMAVDTVASWVASHQQL